MHTVVFSVIIKERKLLFYAFSVIAIVWHFLR